MKETEYKIHYKNFDRLKDILGVYLIRNLDNNTLKIGITDNLPKRYKQIIKTFNFCGSTPKLKIECYIEYKNNLQLEQFFA
jgi:predicted GIY-YIG superfamily endonuclease